MAKPVILCVDDEKTVLDSLSYQISSQFGKEFSIETAGSGEEGIEIIEDILKENTAIAIVISDHLMPGMKGDTFLIEVHKRSPKTLKILLTGQASAEGIGNAVNNAKLYRYLAKPWEKTDLLLTIEEAAKSYFQTLQLEEQNQILQSLYESSAELSAEIHFDILAEKVVKLILKHTKIEKIGLIYFNENNILLKSIGTIEKVEQFKFRTVEQVPVVVPIQLIYQVKNQVEPIFLTQSQFSSFNDPYFIQYRPFRVGCLPMLRNGELRGILYLEQTNLKSPFRKDQLEYVNQLLPLATIALENAHLYSTLETKVQERTMEVMIQKEIIEAKNKDITDSISYASRIQQAILPDLEYISQKVPKFFVIYKPKDIVSGDFYWFGYQGNQFIFAVVDCTGHGVPGAFMSVVGHELLNQIILERKQFSPEKILYLLDEGVRKTLRQDTNDSQDGMDLALCSVDLDTQTLFFGGAHRPLFQVRGESFEEFRGDKDSIGGPVGEYEKQFSETKISYQPGDRFYMFSDGITDLYDADNKYKFSSRRLKEAIQSIQHLCMTEQGQEIERQIEEWRGDAEQIDDLLIVGFEL
ncbi:MAG: SpoIIE family protein phosphatase [Bacteroidia bacterium]|nr:SpoIIE family protein phosphatase [Bacteroidia bacterium]